jgi:hypothetical protein
MPAWSGFCAGRSWRGVAGDAVLISGASRGGFAGFTRAAMGGIPL